ncbi:hypothetical protein ACFSR7_33630 [Cohnella sp. GCM10020058]|uniref:hypothetical protein n=1 Tax=Cohnella sp. GCM10020058 TaxID=3317330 RepID=UPI0036275CBD
MPMPMPIKQTGFRSVLSIAKDALWIVIPLLIAVFEPQGATQKQSSGLTLIASANTLGEALAIDRKFSD